MTGLRSDQVALLLGGSALVVAGSSLAGLYAFGDRSGIVFVGFVLFGAGYRVAQHGQHRDPGDPLLPRPGGGDAGAGSGDAGGGTDSTLRTAGRYGLQAIGLFGIALGVTLFAQTIVDPGGGRAVEAGVVSIGGYMVAHVGINGTLL